MNDPRAYFPFYVADFWGSDAVSLMTMEAVGLYMLMLSREWEQGTISADESFWRNLCAHKCTNWDAAWKQVRPCFDECSGRLTQKRLESERAVADGFSSKQSKKAKAKWERWRASKSAAAQPQQSRGNATSMPGQDRTGQDQTVEDRNGAERKKRAPRAAPAALVLPAPLEPARAAVERWIAYKAENRKAYRPMGLDALLKRLARWGPQKAEQAIEQSMASRWEGLFEPGDPSHEGRKPRSLPSLPQYVPDPTPRNMNPPKLGELLKAELSKKNGHVAP